ncbi:isocitrate/isopropylmalate family dehydrogenase, partial [Streptococcus suis]|uniref:isocitrate/isopropylmalate family dehydrogenase n=1 Tax=Streptococcus suis TaxID=1307 RepID=UPI00207C7B11
IKNKQAEEIESFVRKSFYIEQKTRKKQNIIDKQNVLSTSKLWRKVEDYEANDNPQVFFDHH